MKIQNPSAHIDYLLYQTRMHHVQLSAMADQKASMLLTMASVVITLSIPQLLKSEFRWPLVLLIGFCLITVSLAVYTVMPKLVIPKKGAKKPDVHTPGFDILFFGDFTQLDYPTYQSAMEATMNDVDRVYEVQLREIYAHGSFLVHRKYRFLRLGYVFFLLGLFTSLAALVVTVLTGSAA